MQHFRATLLTVLLTLTAVIAGCTAPSDLPMPANLQAQAAPQVVQPKTQVIAEKLPSSTQIIITPTRESKVTTTLTPEQTTLLASLPSKGPAPELNNKVWLNSAPLKLADLRGKVVMVEFWTFACINCQHVTPSLKALHTKYADKGLVIIGVHSPEFDYEKELTNVQAAITEVGIEYPVAIDNNYVTWNAYNNHYWPARYLIDKAGNIRLLQIGEGGYAKTEAAVQALLAEQNPS
ncbi:MAG: redoxin domain-containing protein [Chloroflexi bacterium]|nr:redoxin domain-containing protein [Chloroflexota bacterium]